jgi:hypothetical protein
MRHIAMNRSTSLMNNMQAFDYTQSIIPILWKFLDKRRRPCFISMNVYKVDNNLVISIIDNKKIRRFKSSDNQNLVKKLTSYLKLS